MAMLEVNHLDVYYGKIHAIKDISLKVEAGELVSLIGANGAGKTSLLTAVMGQIPSTGEITFEGKEIHGTGTMEIVRHGMTMVPEGRRVFPRTSVMDNLLLGSYIQKNRAEAKEDLNKIFDTIVAINQSGTTVMLVEQNANQALRIAKRGYVIETGELVLEDAAERLLDNPQVKESYLGG